MRLRRVLVVLFPMVILRIAASGPPGPAKLPDALASSDVPVVS
jgi:hypothetical protein